MNRLTGRPDHIEDYLVRLHGGQWFGWTNSKNKVWENLVIHHKDKVKPTKKQCEDGLKQLQDEYDAKEYQRNRFLSYPDIGEQLDMLWHAINSGTLNKTSEFYTALKAVKDKYPKSGE